MLYFIRQITDHKVGIFKDEVEEELISAQVELHSNISNSIHIPILHEKEKPENVVDNIVSKSLTCTRTILCNH